MTQKKKSTEKSNGEKTKTSKRAKAPKKKLTVLFVASEAVPFEKTGGLGDVAGSLPKALKNAGVDVRLVIPKYASIPDYYRDELKPVATFETQLSWRQSYVGVERLVHDGVDVYLIDNEYYFNRTRVYGEFDDGERFAYFAKAVCEAVSCVPELSCDIIVCNDWQTALVPVYLRTSYPSLSAVKTVMAVHNVQFQGQYSDAVASDVLGLADNEQAMDALRVDASSVSYLKAGLLYADKIVTVSPTYAQEIQYEFFGEGLDWLFRERSADLSGILNGIDTEAWNPRTDRALIQNYTVENMDGKAVCKRALQYECALPEKADVPLVAMVGRLTAQKGLDMVSQASERILKTGAQLVVLGTGDKRFEDMFLWLQTMYPHQVRAFISFDVPLSKRIYAGADLFLMPSKFEPCGLSQMIAMRYGTLPIVRETGGLRDTVVGYKGADGQAESLANGFSFPHIVADQLACEVERACALYSEAPRVWKQLVKNAMQGEFGWDRAARSYRELFEGMVGLASSPHA